MNFEYIKQGAYSKKCLKDFENLCVKVGEIDEEAEQFLRGLLNNREESYNDYDFVPDGELNACFVFSKTPQGMDYWWDIFSNLDETRFDTTETSEEISVDDFWISVENELPELGTHVLVYLSDKGFQEVPYIVTKFDKYGFNISNVTHWKHLTPPEVFF